MADKILYPSDVQFEKISFRSSTLNASQQKGGKPLGGPRFVNVYYNHDGCYGSKFLVQIPELVATFGIDTSNFNEGNGAFSGPPKYRVNLSLGDVSSISDPENPRRSLYDFMKKFDDFIINESFKNKRFHDKNPPTDYKAASDNYYTCLKEPTEGRTMSVLRVNLGFKADVNEFAFPTFIYDASSPSKVRKVNLMDYVKSPESLRGARMTLIIQCSTVYVSGKNFGATWRATHMLLKLPAKGPEFAFLGNVLKDAVDERNLSSDDEEEDAEEDEEEDDEEEQEDLEEEESGNDEEEADEDDNDNDDDKGRKVDMMEEENEEHPSAEEDQVAPRGARRRLSAVSGAAKKKRAL